MEFSFSYFVYPILTPNIGRFKVFQKYNCAKSQCDRGLDEKLIEIPTGKCSEAKNEQDKNYWESRIPGFAEAVDQYQCVQDDNMYLQSNTIMPDYKAIKIVFQNCIEYAPEDQCKQEKEVINYLSYAKVYL